MYSACHISPSLSVIIQEAEFGSKAGSENPKLKLLTTHPKIQEMIKAT
jgi:hypothetical protein